MCQLCQVGSQRGNSLLPAQLRARARCACLQKYHHVCHVLLAACCLLAHPCMLHMAPQLRKHKCSALTQCTLQACDAMLQLTTSTCCSCCAARAGCHGPAVRQTSKRVEHGVSMDCHPALLLSAHRAAGAQLCVPRDRVQPVHGHGAPSHRRQRHDGATCALHTGPGVERWLLVGKLSHGLGEHALQSHGQHRRGRVRSSPATKHVSCIASNTLHAKAPLKNPKSGCSGVGLGHPPATFVSAVCFASADVRALMSLHTAIICAQH